MKSEKTLIHILKTMGCGVRTRMEALHCVGLIRVGKGFDGGVSHGLASCLVGKEEPTGPVCCRREIWGETWGTRD